MRDAMQSTTAPDLKPIADHFENARGWEANMEALRAKSERRAWIVAGAACAVAFTAVLSLAFLAPFKRTVPYLFAMDKATGNVEYVGAVDERRILGYQELLDKHWAQRYILARESYNYRLLQGDYDTVLGLSSEGVARDYAKLYEGPNARDAKYGNNVEVKATVVSVQLSKNPAGLQAVARFTKTPRRVQSDLSEPTQYYVATIAYEYAPTMFGKEQDLLANPLGYKVTSYRVDAELEVSHADRALAK